MVRDDDIKAYSFDIFDTTLTRCLAVPKDVFFLIQRALEGRHSQDFPQVMVKNFYSLRIQAEIKARFKKCWSQWPEVTVSDIYEEFSRPWSLSSQQKDKLMELELSMEEKMVCPIAWTIDEIESLRKAGKRVIFASDMYLPFEFVAGLLLKAKAYHPESDRIYLSSHTGLQKSSGDLFRYILREEKCRPEQLCHFGDDWYSDIAVPARLGITLYELTPHQIRRVLRYYPFRKINRYLSRLFS